MGEVEDTRRAGQSEWWYLCVTIDARMFNYDQGVLGTWEADPQYLPWENTSSYFFKLQGKEEAARLVRLFDKSVKPLAETDGDMKVRVAFSCHASSEFDEDERFLADEAIEQARENAEKTHMDWRVSQGLGIRGNTIISRRELLKERPPLSGELLADERLHDQAQRWYEKISGEQHSSEPANQDNPVVNTEGTVASDSDSAPSEEVIRLLLPTAVTAAVALRDLNRIREFYPGAIPLDDAHHIHDTLTEQLVSATEACGLSNVFETFQVPRFDEAPSDLESSTLFGMLLLHHPDYQPDWTSSDDVAGRMAAVLDQCQEAASAPVRGIVKRIVHATLYDCRMPAPEGDGTYQEPQRHLQMLRSYWGLIRQFVVHDINAQCAFRPHPATPLIINLKSRIDACFDRLTGCGNQEAVKECVSMLVDTILSGGLDELQDDPKWSYEQLASVDRFIEEARLVLGAKAYALTPAEEMCLREAQRALEKYEARINHESTTVFSWDSPQTEKASSVVRPSPESATQPSGKRQRFSGGEMVFFPDRVELCGVDICSGPRCQTRRSILDLLKKKHENGRFKAYHGEELAKEAGLKGGQGTVAGAVRDLRKDITESLRSKANLECKHNDVILSGDTGYRLADWIGVRDGGQTDRPQTTDID